MIKRALQGRLKTVQPQDLADAAYLLVAIDELREKGFSHGYGLMTHTEGVHDSKPGSADPRWQQLLQALENSHLIKKLPS